MQIDNLCQQLAYVEGTEEQNEVLDIAWGTKDELGGEDFNHFINLRADRLNRPAHR